MRKPIIAIDGTAASGKSTTAQRVAEHFRYLYVDTGAMYRAVTLKALEEGIDITDTLALSNMVEAIDITFRQKDGAVRIFLDQVDVTEQIRSPEVTRHVSAVSEVKQTREALVAKQRELGRGGGVVMEGRDIGTVVFPHADVKVFMVADIHQRARRRCDELRRMGLKVNLKELEGTILERDRWDSSRMFSPLHPASDAQLLDTTHLTIEEQVEIVIRKVERWLQKGKRQHKQ